MSDTPHGDPVQTQQERQRYEPCRRCFGRGYVFRMHQGGCSYSPCLQCFGGGVITPGSRHTGANNYD